MELFSSLILKKNDPQTNYDAVRYSAISYVTSAIHAVFCILFYFMGIPILSLYNLASCIFYVVCGRIVPNTKRFDILYILYCTEIAFHSIFATMLVGWDYGFMFYLVALIPCGFYVAFSVAYFKRQLLYPVLTTVIITVAMVIVRVLTYFIEPAYTVELQFYKIFLHILNILICIGTIFVFSALFSVEVNSIQLQMESAQQNLEDMARIDPLTKFLNRRSMEERLNFAQRNAIINNIPYSLIMTDIDDFKRFNDTYGHDCGDYVLQNISKLISAQIRVKDSACRWGGEEFLILIPEDEITAIEIAQRIRNVIADYDFYYEGKSLHVTLTLGVSSYYENCKVKTLIEIADKRLYKGKANGKNQVVSS